MSTTDPLIKKSPYEPGLYFVLPQPGTTLQSIGTTEWKVGERYTLHKVLGYGSFSCVCLATDNTTGEKVALKRIGDVLHSVDQAKRVLRELAIMHRTSHPNLIGLRDAFVRPSSTGQCRMVNGKLFHASIDLYIAMEYADGGDLFHMKGQLTLEEVASLLWQLLQALSYLHSMNIWHRDVKSQNTFIHWDNGVRVVKLGDLGSARSAIPRQHDNNYFLNKSGNNGGDEQYGGSHRRRRGYISSSNGGDTDIDMIDDDNDNKNNTTNTTTNNKVSHHHHHSRTDRHADHHHHHGNHHDNEYMHTADSYAAMDQAILLSDLYAQPASDNNDTTTTDKNNGHISTHNTNTKKRTSTTNTTIKTGFKAPLTRVVATPCYRAPEVVMSRGGYTASIDMWGAGCVFGELLQRMQYVGSTATPNLQVAPLFAIRGMPKTPDGIETFGNPECIGTRQELKALFDVIGTPAWSDVDTVEMDQWRSYLAKLPGKAPTLYRRFHAAGEVALHLLTRLLDFDPGRRATCEEALSHEFFEELRHEVVMGSVDVSGGGSSKKGVSPFDTRHENDDRGGGEVKIDVAAAMTTTMDVEDNNNNTTTITINNTTTTANTMDDKNIDDADRRLSTLHSESYAAAAAAAAAASAHTAISPTSAERHFYEEVNPGIALAKLEDELKAIISTDAEQDIMSEGCQKLRQLLEAECAAVAADALSQRDSGSTRRSSMASLVKPISKDGRSIDEIFRRRDTTLQVDTAAAQSHGGQTAGDVYAKQRLSNVADTQQGKELDPRKFLGPARHGEWSIDGGGGRGRFDDGGSGSGLRWGVSVVPPGLDGSNDPRVKEIVRKQQER